MVDQRLDAMSAKPLQSMEVTALGAAGRFMRLVWSRVTVPKPAAMQEMGHLRTAHGVGPAADRDAGGRWVRIFGGFEGAHSLDGVGGCYCGPGAGWQPFQATSTPTGAGSFGALLLASVRCWAASVRCCCFGALLIFSTASVRCWPQPTNHPPFCHSKGLRVKLLVGLWGCFA